METSKKRFYFLTALLIIYILFVHNAVFLQHDDYGYGCLNYGYTGDYYGCRWTFSDLINFLRWQYMNWGGRVLFFGVEALILRINDSLIKFFQACIIILTGSIIYSGIKRYKQDSLSLFIVAISFFSIGLITTIEGIYWYTASVIYLWPFLFFYLALLREKRPDVISRIIVGVALFIAGFSQEQIAVAVIAYSLCTLVNEYVKKRALRGEYFCGVIGALSCLLAPGNFARAGGNADFYSLSLSEKILTNVPKIIYVNINITNGARLAIYVAILVLFCFYLKNKYAILINTIAIIALLIACLSSQNGFTIWTGSIFILIFVGEICLYFSKTGEYGYIYLILAAIATQGMMVFSPVIAYRTALPFSMLTIIILSKLVIELLPIVSYPLRVLAIVIIVMTTALNTGFITFGLYQNYGANRFNHVVLNEAGTEEYKDNNAGVLKLRKLQNEMVVNAMPYMDGYEYIDTWIKDYYGIPQEVELVWE